MALYPVSTLIGQFLLINEPNSLFLISSGIPMVRNNMNKYFWPSFRFEMGNRVVDSPSA